MTSLPTPIRAALEPEDPKHTAWLPGAKCEPELRKEIECIAKETGYNRSSLMRAAVRLFISVMRGGDGTSANPSAD